MTEPMPCPPYDGRHLLADLHGCTGLDDAARIKAALADAAVAAGATLLGTHLHRFGPGQGVTGVALLAESHISIHSWPEHGYAAIDIFMCGRAHDLEAALATITDALAPRSIVRRLIERGYEAARPGAR
ncbi:S-adenosylmethionine decarboxylase [Sphingomonas zeicaulis]|uniref:adenosylmethionine decarboxylase n=1 Tax=Sphingomonas zeicaulis TaxID=1632740 RepID=UPI003D23144C